MRLRVAVAAAVAACAVVPVALADGDPASDYLLSQKTFVPYDMKVPKAQSEQLKAIVAAANEQGFKIRVALIGKPFDLGAVPSLWREPKTYAHFLGQELFFLYKGGLLVVMPNGYGASRRGKPLPSAQHVVDTLPSPGEGGAALAAGATRAVRKLAAQEGLKLATPIPSPSSDQSTSSDRIVLAAIAGGLVLLFLAGFAVRRLLTRR
jgi:hypothetical protein